MYPVRILDPTRVLEIRLAGVCVVEVQMDANLIGQIQSSKFYLLQCRQYEREALLCIFWRILAKISFQQRLKPGVGRWPFVQVFVQSFAGGRFDHCALKVVDRSVILNV